MNGRNQWDSNSLLNVCYSSLLTITPPTETPNPLLFSMKAQKSTLILFWKSLFIEKSWLAGIHFETYWYHIFDITIHLLNCISPQWTYVNKRNQGLINFTHLQSVRSFHFSVVAWIMRIFGWSIVIFISNQNLHLPFISVWFNGNKCKYHSNCDWIIRTSISFYKKSDRPWTWQVIF